MVAQLHDMHGTLHCENPEKQRHLTVKRLIIGDLLFGEIGELNKLAKISLSSNKKTSVIRYSSVGNHQINSSLNCHIWKTAKYNSHQIFSFYSYITMLRVYKVQEAKAKQQRLIITNMLIHLCLSMLSMLLWMLTSAFIMFIITTYRSVGSRTS